MRRFPYFLIRLVALLGSLGAAQNALLFAQGSKLGLSPENQKRYDELMHSARKNQMIGAVAIQVGAGFLCLGLLWGAYRTHKKGFQISKGKRLRGTVATLVAGGVVILALVVATVGVVYGLKAMP